MNALSPRSVASLVLLSLLSIKGAAVHGNEALDPRLKPGIASLQAGQLSEAHAAFMTLFVEEPENAQVNFHLGMAAMALGDYEGASLAFERTLMAEPDMERARLELARAYLELGLLDTARSYLAEVLDSNPPENVARNVQRLTEQIDAATRRQNLSGTLSVGVHYDTNAGASPTDSSVDTPALGVPNVQVEDEQEDVYTSLMLHAQHAMKFDQPNLGWRSSLLFYSTAYAKEGDQDLQFARIATGPAWQQPERAVDLAVVGEYLAKEGDDYSMALGGQARFVQTLWQRHVLVGEVLLLAREYEQEPDRRAHTLGFSIGPVFEWGSNRLVTRVGVETEDARDGDDAVEEDELSHARYSGRVAYERRLPRNATARAEYKFTHTNYEADYAAFARDRQDRVHAVQVGLQKQLADNVLLDLSNTFTTAHSSIELYEYDRNVTSLVLQWSF